VSEGVTVVSDAHRDMIRQLEERGFEVMEEIPFPPYQVDIYVPLFHMCVEVDGPQHGKRADEKRNEALVRVYSLPTFRVKSGDVNPPDRWESDLTEFVKEHALTAGTRWEKCAMKVPWL